MEGLPEQYILLHFDYTLLVGPYHRLLSYRLKKIGAEPAKHGPIKGWRIPEQAVSNLPAMFRTWQASVERLSSGADERRKAAARRKFRKLVAENVGLALQLYADVTESEHILAVAHNHHVLRFFREKGLATRNIEACAEIAAALDLPADENPGLVEAIKAHKVKFILKVLADYHAKAHH